MSTLDAQIAFQKSMQCSIQVI